MDRLTAKHFIFAFLLLIGASFLIYRHGIVAIPRGDHRAFMLNHGFHESDWEYFRQSISYSRTRHFGPGDYYLFRPGMHSVLAILQIASGNNFYLRGATSILIHALTTFSLFLLLSRFLRLDVSCILTLVFLTQYPGMEMVFWRHISPYMFSLMFFGFGLCLLHRPLKTFTSTICRFGAALMFFISMTFHEILLPVLLLCGPILAVMTRPDKESTQTDREVNIYTKSDWIMVTILPVILWVVLNLADYLIYQPPGLLGPSDSLDLSNLISGLFTVAGLSLLTSFFPYVVHLVFHDLRLRAFWDFSEFPQAILWVLGFILMVSLIWIFYRACCRIRRPDERQQAALLMLVTAYLGAVILGVTAGRVSLRSMQYMHSATYYYYMTTFGFLILVSLLVHRFQKSEKARGNLILGVVALVAVPMILHNYSSLQQLLTPRSGYDKMIADNTLTITRSIQANAGQCYGGSLDPTLSSNLLDTYLHEEACSNMEDTPLYILSGPSGNTWHSQFNEFKKDEVLLGFGQLKPTFQDNGIVVIQDPQNSGQVVLGQINADFDQLVLSEKSYNPDYYSARFYNTADAGLIMGYHDADNYVGFRRTQAAFFMYVIENGELAWHRQFDSPPSPNNTFRFSIHQDNEAYYILSNQRVLGVVPSDRILEGKVGLVLGPVQQSFSDVVVSESRRQQPIHDRLQSVIPLEIRK